MKPINDAFATHPTLDIEAVRTFALGLHAAVTEDLFADHWLSFRIGGHWFLLMQLDAPEPRVAVKLAPAEAQQLRDEYVGITPAYHLNKRHWSDLYLEQLHADLVRQCIATSFQLVASKLPKAQRQQLGIDRADL